MLGQSAARFSAVLASGRNMWYCEALRGRGRDDAPRNTWYCGGMHGALLAALGLPGLRSATRVVPCGGLSGYTADVLFYCVLHSNRRISFRSRFEITEL